MRNFKFFVFISALLMLLPFATHAQEGRSPRAEIHIVNDMNTQVSLWITTEKTGRLSYTWKVGNSSYASFNGTRLRVSGRDRIEIADWGVTSIEEVATFEDGVWQLRLRNARHNSHRPAPRGEIHINNDTESQVSLFISTERTGRLSYTWKPGNSSYASYNNTRLRVAGRDTIEIADWGTAYIENVAVFENGVWQISMRQARRALLGGHRR